MNSLAAGQQGMSSMGGWWAEESAAPNEQLQRKPRDHLLGTGRYPVASRARWPLAKGTVEPLSLRMPTLETAWPPPVGSTLGLRARMSPVAPGCRPVDSLGRHRQSLTVPTAVPWEAGRPGAAKTRPLGRILGGRSIQNHPQHCVKMQISGLCSYRPCRLRAGVGPRQPHAGGTRL